MGFLAVVPDLAEEVVWPSDGVDAVQAKIEQWLWYGVRLVWMVYPGTRSVTAYRGLDDVPVLTEDDDLLGEPVLPGFSCPVREIF